MLPGDMIHTLINKFDVVFFNQQTAALHAIPKSESSISAFKQIFPFPILAQTGKKKKKHKKYRKYRKNL